MKSLYLIDISYFLFRAYYALPPLKTSKDFPTNSLRGFLSMLLKLLKEKRPDYIAGCFDRKEPSFRTHIFPEYKSHRKDTPEDLLVQLPYTKPLTTALGIPSFEKESFEADDVIGSLACYGKKHNLNVVIVSGDKDFAQLVDPSVVLLDSMREIQYREEDVKKKWGVFPHQMIDYLALVGDSSDNIPGVRGIGEKGACKLLEQFGNLDNIYKNLDNISGRSLKQKLNEGKELAYLSKTLVTISCDIDFHLSLEDLKLKPRNQESLKNLCEELEFQSLLKVLEKEKEKKQKGSSEKKVSLKVSNQPLLKREINKLAWKAQQVSKEIPSYSEVWLFYHKEILYLGFQNKLISVPKEELKNLTPIMERKILYLKGFHLKDIWKKLNLLNPLQPKIDLMLMAYILDGRALKESFEDTYKRQLKKNEISLESAESVYLAHLELEKHFYQVLQNKDLKKLKSVLYEIDFPLVPVLYHMEKTGIDINQKSLKEQSKKLEEEIRNLEKKIQKEAGVSFNIGSPKQLAHVLFEVKGLPWSKKIKTGYSTDNRVLKKLENHPIVKDVLDFRECVKLKTTYVDALIHLQDQKSGRVYSHFHQTGTHTGRLSSTNPNLQNIPIRTKRGQMIRKSFQASPGSLFISADYNQIELRVLAHMTEDPALIKAFQEDKDIHASTACEIFNLASLNEVTEDLRRAAKAVNFGIVYGQGAFGLSESLNISYEEASEIIQRYFKRFKKVKEYMLEVVDLAKKQNYVENIFGRRRKMEELKSQNLNTRKFGERAAVNSIIQGSSSDIVKMAMLQLYENLSFPLLLQVHDELLFESPQEDVRENAKEVKDIMENTVTLKVNLKVNTGWGKDWDSAHP